MINEICSFTIPGSIKTLMEKHAQKVYPGECCGIMLGRKKENGISEIVKIYEAENLERQITGTDRSPHHIQGRKTIYGVGVGDYRVLPFTSG